MKQGSNARLDESLGMRHRGPHMQSFKDRRDESKGEEKHKSKPAYSGDSAMDERYHDHMASAHHKYMSSHYRRRTHKNK